MGYSNEVNKFVEVDLSGEVKNRIENLPQNILLYGGSLDGSTPNDTAFNSAKLVNRKSDYFGHVYFPNNEVGNAVYYFTSVPFMDKTVISADKGVKLSFPSTNGRSFKDVRFKDDIIIISRDRNNEGKQYKDEYSKLLFSTLTQNDVEVGIKKPVMMQDSDFQKLAYFTDNNNTGSASFGSYDTSNRLLYKVTDTAQITNNGKLNTIQFPFEMGSYYNSLSIAINDETSNDVRYGVVFAKDGGNFLYYSIDRQGYLYKGIRTNNTWTETRNTKFDTVLTDAYKLRRPLLLGARPVSANRVEIYLNGVLVDVVDVSFSAAKLGFALNTVNQSGSGILNVVFGNIIKSQAQKVNVGRDLVLKAFGDSITFGEGSISWAEYLPKFLEGQRGINKVTITNKAISGNTSAQQLSVMQAEDLTNTDMVLILIGTNDIQGSVSATTFRDNVQAMIDLAQGKKVILGIPPMWISQGLTGQGFASSRYDHGAQIRAMVLQLAATNSNVFIADTLSEIGRIGADNHNATLRDNLHPNTFGEILLSRCFARSIISALTNDVTVGKSEKVIDTANYSPTLQNGWVNFGGLYADSRYYKDSSGVVYMEGLIKSGTTTSGTVITNLPAGYRPDKTLMFFVGASTGAATVEVQANGNVIASGGFSSTWTSLAGVNFRPV